MALAGAAVLAAVHVLEVLTATPLWRFSEIATYVLLAVAVRAEPRWLGPVLLAPLLLDALLTIPPAGPRTYGWQVLTPSQEINPGLDALDQGFRQGGAMVLFVLALNLTTRRRWPAGRAAIAALLRLRGAGLLRLRGAGLLRLGVAALLDLGVVGYAAGRVALAGRDLAVSSVVALMLAVLVPVVLALAALAFAASAGGWAGGWAAGWAGGWAAALGGVLIAAGTLPMIDAMIGAVPLPYSHYGTGLFGWDAITPTTTFPQPVAAIEEGLLLAGVICALVKARFKPSGG